MSAHERELRSAINRILSQQGLLHGTLITRKRVCGKSRQMYVPRELEASVRQWIAQYDQARQILDELSSMHWDKVRNRQE